jgi:DNA-binding NarL/FixJ family response regulator
VALRLLLVDDNVPFLEAARALFEREGVAVVGVASTSSEALLLVEDLRPDVTLIDIDLGAESGFDLARRLARAGAESRMILISTHDEDDFAGLIDASPAVGFVPKSRLDASAVHEVLRRDGNTGPDPA